MFKLAKLVFVLVLPRYQVSVYKTIGPLVYEGINNLVSGAFLKCFSIDEMDHNEPSHLDLQRLPSSQTLIIIKFELNFCC